MHRIFFLFCFLFTSFLFADIYDTKIVSSIDFIPCNAHAGQSFDRKSTQAKLLTKVGVPFSQDDFDRDLKCLSEEFSVVEPILDADPNGVAIVLRLWFKPVIRDVVFCGNNHVATKKLKKELEISSGATYDQEGFLEDFNKLRRLYVKKGYFESQLSYSVEHHPDCNEVTIHVEIFEGLAGKINTIHFCGVSQQEESDLRELMISKPYNFLLSWYIGGGIYHPEMIEHDQMQVINFFQNLGYADAIATISYERDDHNRLALQVTVDRGELYTIGHMAMQGNTLFSNACLWDQFRFGRGSVFSPESIRQTVQNITDLYGSNGYVDASVDMQLSLRDAEPVYDVCLVIEEGAQYQVGLIKVFGNECTRTGLILHENLLCPGAVFDTRKLEGTETRLANTGYFKSVNVYAVKSQYEDPFCPSQFRDVYVELEEADTGNVGLFFGFSSIERLFGGVEVSEMNFNLAGLGRLMADGPGAMRGAGEYAHFKVNVGDRQTTYLAQWTKPYFLDTPWIVGVDLEKSNNRVLSRAYEIKTYGGSCHATYIKNAFLKYNFYYRADHTSTAVKGNQSALLETEGAESGLISAVGLNLIYDSTNSARKPTNGFRSRFVYELAGLGGNFSFMKFAYLNSYYYPFSKRGTFKLRADLQFLHTYRTTTPDDLPLGERFFLGGETTVRGYKPFVIGPLYGNLEPRGGVSSILVTEEYQHNLLKAPCLDGFVFLDAGMITMSEFTLTNYAAAVGLGIRVEAMKNVPMMLGVGWPIHPGVRANGEKIDNAQRFFFSMGGTF